MLHSHLYHFTSIENFPHYKICKFNYDKIKALEILSFLRLKDIFCRKRIDLNKKNIGNCIFLQICKNYIVPVKFYSEQKIR